MKLLKAKSQKQKKIILEISKLQYIKSMTPLPELLNGEELQNPIEVRKHNVSPVQRKGVGGVVYEMLEWPLTGMNHYSFVGAFSGLAVALFFNYTVRLDLN